MSVVVLKPGLLTTLQDRGRHGHAALGVGAAGPMDEVAFRLANALVGNADAAAAIEISLLGPRLRFEAPTLIAFTGAEFDVRINQMSAPGWRPLHVAAGSVLEFGPARCGARAYLAVAGGFAAQSVLGSMATDVNARLGPLGGRPLQAGDVIAFPVARATNVPEPRECPPTWSLDPRPWFDADPAHPIRLIRGPHCDTLDEASLAALFTQEFRIGIDSNRVGYRLDGTRLMLAAPLELVSEAVAFGSVQLPPGGQPIVLMAEHPTTGGYPRIGQVAAVDLPRLAQRQAGDRVRFREIGVDEAQTRYLSRERELARVIDTIAMRLAQ
jgi:antagonist of KipI